MIFPEISGIPSDLLTGNGQARYGLLVGEFKADFLCVRADILGLGHRQVDESLVTTNENLRAILRLSYCRAVVAIQTNADTSGTDSGINGSQRLLALRCSGGVAAEALQGCLVSAIPSGCA